MYSLSPESFTLVIPLTSELLQWFFPEVIVGGVQLLRKDELHLTIIGFGKAKLIGQAFESNPSIQHQINSFLSTKTFQISSIPNTYYFIRKEYQSKTGGLSTTRSSIIQPVSCPDLAQFTQELKSLFSHPAFAKEPYPHLTLYTDRENPMGIGIDGASDFQALGPQLIPPQILLAK